jgi:hypothetical protein
VAQRETGAGEHAVLPAAPDLVERGPGRTVVHSRKVGLGDEEPARAAEPRAKLEIFFCGKARVEAAHVLESRAAAEPRLREIRHLAPVSDPVEVARSADQPAVLPVFLVDPAAEARHAWALGHGRERARQKSAHELDVAVEEEQPVRGGALGAAIAVAPGVVFSSGPLRGRARAVRDPARLRQAAGRRPSRLRHPPLRAFSHADRQRSR